MANEYRVTQVAFEVLHSGDSRARVTQVALEVLHSGDTGARVTQVALEVLRTVTGTTGRRRQMINN